MTNEGANLTKDTDVVVDATSEPALRSPEANSLLKTWMAIAVTLIIAAIAITLWILRPPLDQYTQSVLNLSGDPVQGRCKLRFESRSCGTVWD